MKLEQAKRILGITETDDTKTIKYKFRRLISQYHPDAVGSDLPERIQKAQGINEAYRIMKAQIKIQDMIPSVPDWEGECSEAAYIERDIYMPYTLNTDSGELYQTVAHGKYFWDPDLEEFELFLRSIRHASAEILSAIEEQSGCYGNAISEHRFPFQVKLFQYLAGQFIHPIRCLEKLAEPESIDREGREIYRFRAFLGAKGASGAFYHIEKLKENDLIYPVSLKNNRIMTADESGHDLGNLSLEDDALYFCLIPLLKAHAAQIKMTVRKVSANRKQRPYQAKADIELMFRLECSSKTFSLPDTNGKIHELLVQYEEMLKNVSSLHF